MTGAQTLLAAAANRLNRAVTIQWHAILTRTPSP
jgi:hypothetical protein